MPQIVACSCKRVARIKWAKSRQQYYCLNSHWEWRGKRLANVHVAADGIGWYCGRRGHFTLYAREGDMMTLKYLQGKLQELLNINDDFAESSNHKWDCKCDKCKLWWKVLGPDPDTGQYGPFTKEEIEGP